MRINIKESAALIIDIQEKLFPHINDHNQLARNTEILIKGLKSLELPFLITEQYVKGLGSTIPVLSNVLQKHNAIEKMSFSCCDEPSFSKDLEKLNKKFIIIAGIEAHVCVMQTAIDLMERGYQAVVIEDCVASRSENDKNIAIHRMREESVIISTYESILFELTRLSGTDKFKSISKLVK